MAHQQTHPGLVPGMQYGQHMGPPNPGQPPGQGLPPQMMPGVSGPNGLHVSQAAMMAGIQPGVGGGGPGMPNAHALSHLTPQVFQQQQMLQGMLLLSRLAVLFTIQSTLSKHREEEKSHTYAVPFAPDLQTLASIVVWKRS